MYQMMYAIRYYFHVLHSNSVHLRPIFGAGIMYLSHQLSLYDIATIPQSNLIFKPSEFIERDESVTTNDPVSKARGNS
jgi:hypothetical protein